MILLAAAASVTVASADNIKSVDVAKLPDKAREFIDRHFGELSVAAAKKETFPTEYDVVFANGYKAEFDADGEWIEIDCRRDAVPAMAVPVQIREYVAKNYPAQRIVSISRNRHGYDVQLDNGYELGFDRRFRLTEFDD